MDAPTLADLFFRLGEGVASNKHDFHLMTVASCHQGVPHARMVVLRSADRAGLRLSFHTDARSPKVAQLQANPAVECHLYHRASKLQVRAGGRAILHREDEMTAARWSRTSPSARRCYLSDAPPGDDLPAGVTALPEAWHDMPPSLAESEAGYAQFCVVEIAIESLDLLVLHAAGHSRWQLQEGLFRPVVP